MSGPRGAHGVRAVFIGDLLGLAVRCVRDAFADGVFCMATGERADRAGRPQWHCHITEPRLADAESATVRVWLAGCLAAPQRRAAR